MIGKPRDEEQPLHGSVSARCGAPVTTRSVAHRKRGLLGDIGALEARIAQNRRNTQQKKAEPPFQAARLTVLLLRVDLLRPAKRARKI